MKETFDHPGSLERSFPPYVQGPFLPMPVFQELYLEVTRKCNAACAHCYVSSSPHETPEGLSPGKIKELFYDAATLPELLPRLVISGGEPTLQFERLCQLLDLAHEAGLTTAIITNGWWGRSGDLAKRYLVRLKEAHLGRLELSLSRYHLRFVSATAPQTILNRAADYGIIARVLIRHRDGDEQWLPDGFDVPSGVQVCATAVTRHGRATSSVPQSHFTAATHSRPSGNCHRDLSLTITPKGDVYPCCCGSELTETLKLGNVLAEPLSDIVVRSRRNGLLRAIVQKGPAWTLTHLESSGLLEAPVTESATICELCTSTFCRNESGSAVIKEFFDVYLPPQPSIAVIDNRLAREGVTLTRGRSGADLLCFSGAMWKTAVGPAVVKLTAQVRWLLRMNALGVKSLPEVWDLLHSSNRISYAMKLYALLDARHHEPRLLASRILNALQDVWAVPVQDSSPINASQYIHYVVAILGESERDLATRLYGLSFSLTSYVVDSRPQCEIHGDPTFSNVAVDENDCLILLDPNPHQPGNVRIPEMDGAKVLTSLLGWEGLFLHGHLQPLNSGRDLFQERFGDSAWPAIMWLAVSHLVRALPYCKSPYQTETLLNEIRIWISEAEQERIYP
jgi:hypothetical protein